MAMEYLPRCFNGVSWGAAPRVIARKANELYLLWIPGNTAYVDRVIGSRYGASRLRIVPASNSNSRLGQELHKGGRLSLSLVRSLAEKIDAAFGEGTTAKITLRDTVQIKELDGDESNWQPVTEAMKADPNFTAIGQDAKGNIFRFWNGGGDWLRETTGDYGEDAEYSEDLCFPVKWKPLSTAEA